MIGTMTLKIKGPAPGGITKREWAKISKVAYAGVADWWHSERRKEHFTHRAPTEFRYATRQGDRMSPGSKRYRASYIASKLRQQGHALSLIWTGRSMRRTEARKISATSKRAQLTMKGGSFGRRHPSDRIDMKGELTRMSDADRRGAAEFLAASLNEFIADVRIAKTIRIR